MRQPKAKNEDIVTMYTEQHLTCVEIGKLIGMSRVGVWKRLQTAGVGSQEGERVSITCDLCGESGETTRRKWRNHNRHFCSAECYYKALYNPSYHFHRQGQRLARKVVAKVFPLEPKHVVHHMDSDTDNNTIGNLWVFATQSDHMRFHRGGDTRPLWKV